MNRFDRVFKDKRQTDGQQEALKAAPKPATAVAETQPDKVLDYDKDPRPDLEGDHALWVALFTATRMRGNVELLSILYALRCGGASLERHKDLGMLIRPGEWEEAAYKEFTAAHLTARKAEVVEVLRGAAKLLPQAERDTLNARVIARVRGIEPKAIALGWTKQEIWAEKEWRDPRYGRQMQSIYRSLLGASQTWGHAELGEITAEYVEILVPGPGLSSEATILRECKVPPEFQGPTLFGDVGGAMTATGDAETNAATSAQNSAPLKKREAAETVAQEAIA